MDSQIASKNPENPVTASTIKASFLATYHRQQLWLLPATLIYYITKNPLSAKIYEKLIQSCKHFFIKNQIIVAPNLGSKLLSEECFVYQQYGKYLHIQNISTKLWITEELELYRKQLLSLIIPKIYQCHVKKLCVSNQNIFFNDFIFLSSKCEDIYLNGVIVSYKNGTAVKLENIIAVLENIKSFSYFFDLNTNVVVTSTTVQELLKIPCFAKLRYLMLFNIPELFDIECLYDYIKKNKKTRFNLRFCDTISEAYSKRLQKIVNEILGNENRKFRVPFIYFSGIDPTYISSLIDLQR